MTIDGPILIIAGAGSGKTRVITYRIAHILDKGIPQSAILALTFTNKAAREMGERVKALTSKKLQNLTVSTFHAFSVRILRQDIDKLDWRENFSIYNETDKSSLAKERARELQFTSDVLAVYKIANPFQTSKIGRDKRYVPRALRIVRAGIEAVQRGRLRQSHHAADPACSMNTPTRLQK